MRKIFRLMTESGVAILLLGLMLTTVGLRPLPVYADEISSDVGTVELSYEVVDNRKDIVSIPATASSRAETNYAIPNTGYDAQAMLYIILLTFASGIFLLYIDILQSKSDT